MDLSAPAAAAVGVPSATVSGAAGGSHCISGGARLSNSHIRAALRLACHVKECSPSAEQLRHLAQRYVAQRTAVTPLTVYQALVDAYAQHSVAVLREFPGAVPPMHLSVAEWSAQVASVPSPQRKYVYNDRGHVIHYMLQLMPHGDANVQVAQSWWAPINELYRRPAGSVHSGRTNWTIVSRRAGSLLHLDDFDSTNSQWVGCKLWAVVDQAEAADAGIEEIDADVLRGRPRPTHTWEQWLGCSSFRWFIMEQGDTLLLPRNMLHGVRCIGDVDSISTGTYVQLRQQQPASTANHTQQRSSGRKRARSLSRPVSRTPDAKPTNDSSRAEADGPCDGDLSIVGLLRGYARGPAWPNASCAALCCSRVGTCVVGIWQWRRLAETSNERTVVDRGAVPSAHAAFEVGVCATTPRVSLSMIAALCTAPQ